MAGRIIIVNGTSGSGKSTPASCSPSSRTTSGCFTASTISSPIAFPPNSATTARAAEGIQAVPVDGDPEGPLRWIWPAGPCCLPHAPCMDRGGAHQGCNIVLDHLTMTDPPVLHDLVWRLDGLHVLFVCLRPPFEVLEQRVANRAMDKPLPVEMLGEDAVRKIIDRLGRLRPWFYEAVYANDIHDLTIDTSSHTPEEVVAMIEARMAEGPGEAFGKLRERYPRG